MTDTIDPTTTLGELVNENPALTRQLERLELDYCCGGTRTLADACDALGLDPVHIAAELAAATADHEEGAAWADLGPAELVDHLEGTHHAYLHAELPRLAVLIEKVAEVHAVLHPEIVGAKRIFAALRADLEPHLQREEQVLFPEIRRLASSEATYPFHCDNQRQRISVFLAEHDQAGHLLASLRRLTGGYVVPADACASYKALYVGLEELEADTHLHIHKENNLLFPMVVDLDSGSIGDHR